MFDNIGEKIKGLAVFCAYACVICGILVAVIGLIMYATEADYLEYATAYGGAGSGYDLLTEAGNKAYTGLQMLKYGLISGVIGFVSAWPLYGFGQLIENSDILVKQSNKLPEKQNNTNYTTITSSINEETKHLWRCDGCGNMISENVCPICHKASEGITEKLETLNK